MNESLRGTGSVSCRRRMALNNSHQGLGFSAARRGRKGETRLCLQAKDWLSSSIGRTAPCKRCCVSEPGLLQIRVNIGHARQYQHMIGSFCLFETDSFVLIGATIACLDSSSNCTLQYNTMQKAGAVNTIVYGPGETTTPQGRGQRGGFQKIQGHARLPGQHQRGNWLCARPPQLWIGNAAINCFSKGSAGSERVGEWLVCLLRQVLFGRCCPLQTAWGLCWGHLVGTGLATAGGG